MPNGNGDEFANEDNLRSKDEGNAGIQADMRKAQAGDRQAMGKLVGDFRGYLLAIANAELDETIRGKVAVSDVVQETMMRAQQKLPDFRGSNEQELRGWIRKILLHYIADVRKAYRGTDKRRIDREVSLNKKAEFSGDQLLQLAIDTATPGRALIAGEELSRLKTAIASLNEEQRTVLTLRTWERLPFSEVGKRMDRSADAARMLWARAVKQLSEKLQSISK